MNIVLITEKKKLSGGLRIPTSEFAFVFDLHQLPLSPSRNTYLSGFYPQAFIKFST